MQAQHLQGKVALVTGAGAGAGRAVALALGRAGVSVGVCDINPDRAEATADLIRAAGGVALPWAADVGNRFQVSAMIERLRDEYAGLHLLVSGWAVNKEAPFLTLDEYDWRRVIEVNLTGAFLVIQLAARVMAGEGGGRIVQLVSEPPAAARQSPYVASQAGLRALVPALDAELAPLGVRARAVSLAGGEADGWAGTVATSLDFLAGGGALG